MLMRVEKCAQSNRVRDTARYFRREGDSFEIQSTTPRKKGGTFETYIGPRAARKKNQ